MSSCGHALYRPACLIYIENVWRGIVLQGQANCVYTQVHGPNIVMPSVWVCRDVEIDREDVCVCGSPDPECLGDLIPGHGKAVFQETLLC
jgi:hypothetical protein